MIMFQQENSLTMESNQKLPKNSKIESNTEQ